MKQASEPHTDPDVFRWCYDVCPRYRTKV